MEKKETEKEELTLQNVPKAVNYLINEIAEMRAVLEHIESQLGLGVDKHRPIDIERAAEILGQTKNVIKKIPGTVRLYSFLKRNLKKSKTIVKIYRKIKFNPK